jgi:hypothetical protein
VNTNCRQRKCRSSFNTEKQPERVGGKLKSAKCEAEGVFTGLMHGELQQSKDCEVSAGSNESEGTVVRTAGVDGENHGTHCPGEEQWEVREWLSRDETAVN